MGHASQLAWSSLLVHIQLIESESSSVIVTTYFFSTIGGTLSLWAAMLVIFCVEVLLPIPFTLAILSAFFIALTYILMELFGSTGNRLSR